ncbi:glycosyltransferase [Butyrivibrio sp. AE2032]|uniref:glycosyltransferase n=1 Tax=Butyrivibrio sp. AE2032 TaxID=1458463 RepID=UPI000557667F|nr:glycosyltransferase [Butyrivibrio sp. AE2032]
MKVKKVLYIVHESGLGGANRSLIDYLHVVDKLVCPIVVLPSNGPAEVRLRQLGIRYFVIPFKNGYGRIGEYSERDIACNFIDNYEAAKQLASVVELEGIDIIHSNSSVINVGAMASAMTNVPHIWHVREFMEEDFGWEHWDKDLKKRLLSCTSEVVSISDAVRIDFEGKYGFESCRIYDGIDVKCTDKNLKQDNNSFLFAGSISENKGQMDAVLAMNELVKSGGDAKLYIIGNGNAQVKWVIKRFIKYNGLEKNIELIAYCDDLSEWRERCAFSITGSKMEALGRVTVEAMADGLIPIGTDMGGTAELIGEDGGRGFLYEYGNYYQLAQKMISAINLSTEDKRAITFRMKKYVKDTFCTNEYARKLNEVYDRIALKDVKNDERLELHKYLKERYLSLRTKYTPKVGDERNYSILRKQIKQKLTIIIEYCKENDIKKVAIYGMGDVGCALYDAFDVNGIRIVGVMDRSQKYLGIVVNVIKLGDDLKDVDCVFVTTIKDELKMVEQLRQTYSVRVFGVLSLCEGK